MYWNMHSLEIIDRYTYLYRYRYIYIDIDKARDIYRYM